MKIAQIEGNTIRWITPYVWLSTKPDIVVPDHYTNAKMYDPTTNWIPEYPFELVFEDIPDDAQEGWIKEGDQFGPAEYVYTIDEKNNVISINTRMQQTTPIKALNTCISLGEEIPETCVRPVEIVCPYQLAQINDRYVDGKFITPDFEAEKEERIADRVAEKILKLLNGGNLMNITPPPIQSK